LEINAVVASCVVDVPGLAVGAVGIPVNAGLANKAPPTPVKSETKKVTAPVLELKDVTVFNPNSARTKAVVAIWVLLVPRLAVGAAGTPVNVGLANGAGLKPKAVVTSPDANTMAPVLELKEVTGELEAATFNRPPEVMVKVSPIWTTPNCVVVASWGLGATLVAVLSKTENRSPTIGGLIKGLTKPRVTKFPLITVV